MSTSTLDLDHWNRNSIIIGALAWILVLLARWSGWLMLSDPKLILLLALCVITPLAVPLVPLTSRSQSLRRLFRLVIFVQPWATFFGGVSLLLPGGLVAAAIASVWFLFSVLIALIGILLLLQPGGRGLAAVCLAVALLYVPIGSAWLLLDRLGLRPLGFDPTIVLLTAVHFHFITLAMLIMAGLTGRAMQATQRKLPREIYRVMAICLLLDPLLVATGITTTQVSGSHLLESIAAVLLAVNLILISLLNLLFVVPATAPLLARGLLLFSSTAVVITMLFACAYALGEETGAWTITIAQMITIHGWINALVFGLCGLLGWRLSIDTHARKQYPGEKSVLSIEQGKA